MRYPLSSVAWFLWTNGATIGHSRATLVPGMAILFSYEDAAYRHGRSNVRNKGPAVVVNDASPSHTARFSLTIRCVAKQGICTVVLREPFAFRSGVRDNAGSDLRRGRLDGAPVWCNPQCSIRPIISELRWGGAISFPGLKGLSGLIGHRYEGGLWVESRAA